MKKLIALSLTLIMVMSVSVGCTTPKTAREILSDALAKSRQLKTLSSKQALTAQLTVPEEVLPQEGLSASVIEAINNGSVTIDITQDLVNHLSNGNLTVSQNGLDFGFDLFIESNDKIYVKTPFSDKYIVQSTSQTQMRALLDGLRENRQTIDNVILENIDDSQLSVEYNVEYTNDGTTQKLDYITINFTDEQLYNMIMNLAEAFKSDPELLGILTEWTYTRLTAQGLTVDDEMSKETALEELTEKINLIKQIKQDITFNNVTLVLGVNSANDIIDSLTTADFSYVAEGNTYTAKLNHSAQNYAIDQAYQDNSVEINDDNSTGLEDFIMQMLFSNGLNM